MVCADLTPQPLTCYLPKTNCSYSHSIVEVHDAQMSSVLQEMQPSVTNLEDNALEIVPEIHAVHSTTYLSPQE